MVASVSKSSAAGEHSKQAVKEHFWPLSCHPRWVWSKRGVNLILKFPGRGYLSHPGHPKVCSKGTFGSLWIVQEIIAYLGDQFLESSREWLQQGRVLLAPSHLLISARHLLPTHPCKSSEGRMLFLFCIPLSVTSSRL